MIVRKLTKIATGVFLLVIALCVSFTAWVVYVFWQYERIGNSIRIGEIQNQIDEKLSEDFEKEFASLEVLKYRFETEELRSLVESGSVLVVYSYPEAAGPFFFLVFDKDGVLTHKFVPGAN